VIEEEEHARRRGARVYAMLPDAGVAVEPPAALGHIELSGESAARSMTTALKAADLVATDVDYICAHGNSIPDHDISETSGIKLAFGTFAANIPISSIKSMCGQAFAASGAMQVVTACLALQHGLVPPTINYLVPDPKCDLDYVPNTARLVRMRHALVHIRSLGGTHVSIVLSRYR
jgi:3-oxoacyl-[acyl-carrier-protein] synthase II